MRHVFQPKRQLCVGGCDTVEDINHLFLSYDFLGEFGIEFLVGLVLVWCTVLTCHII